MRVKSRVRCHTLISHFYFMNKICRWTDFYSLVCKIIHGEMALEVCQGISIIKTEKTAAENALPVAATLADENDITRYQGLFIKDEDNDILKLGFFVWKMNKWERRGRSKGVKGSNNFENNDNDCQWEGGEDGRTGNELWRPPPFKEIICFSLYELWFWKLIHNLVLLLKRGSVS